MDFMKSIKNGSASLFVIIFISSVILFYFITFSGLSSFYSLSSNILKKEQNNIKLKDLLLFSVEVVAKKKDIKFPIEFVWPRFPENFIMINFDKEKNIIDVFVLNQSKEAIEKVSAELEFISDKKVLIKNAKL